ncbi:hypothetical protein [Heliobacterium mobile]|nr:hypothetical protein [Heliobacterium mobile]
MEHLVVSIIIWSLVLIIIPMKRIFELRYAVYVSMVWMIFLDNLSSYLGFYSFEHVLIPIGRASLFQLLAYSGIGILMINWLTKSSISKLISVTSVAAVFSILQYAYIQRGAFKYGSFDMIFSVIYSIAALSLFIWLSLAIVGEDKVYSGKKTRDIIK